MAKRAYDDDDDAVLAKLGFDTRLNDAYEPTVPGADADPEAIQDVIERIERPLELAPAPPAPDPLLNTRQAEPASADALALNLLLNNQARAIPYAIQREIFINQKDYLAFWFRWTGYTQRHTALRERKTLAMWRRFLQFDGTQVDSEEVSGERARITVKWNNIPAEKMAELTHPDAVPLSQVPFITSTFLRAHVDFECDTPEDLFFVEALNFVLL